MHIRLTNFQSHADSTIEVTGGITALTGSSNAGKSSFIRALSHLKNNNLKGTEYIRKGTDQCTIVVDDIQRIKAKAENCYICAGNKTEALRGGVPIEVIKALNLSDDCIQTQHDAIFLLNKSPGFVATRLAELIDLDVAHRAVKVVDKDRREAYAELNINAVAIKKHQERIEELSVIDTMDVALAAIEKKQGIINDYTEKQATLQSLIDIAVVRRTELNSLPDIQPLRGCARLIAKVVTLEADKKEVANVDRLLRTAVARSDEMRALPPVHKLHALPTLVNTAADLMMNRVDLKVLNDAVTTARTLAAKRLTVPEVIGTLIGEIEQLDEEVKELTLYTTNAWASIARVTDCSMELARLKADYKEAMGDKCPLCFSKIKK